MKYFTYGSNMSVQRIQQRAPSARVIGIYTLSKHALRFHKRGRDGSGKCDASYTGDISDVVFGVLYDINLSDKPALDSAEGLGCGYDDKTVYVSDLQGHLEQAVTYFATNIDDNLVPYSWYKEHVLIGARAANLSADYIEKIEAIETIKDPSQQRESKERAIYK